MADNAVKPIPDIRHHDTFWDGKNQTDYEPLTSISTETNKSFPGVTIRPAPHLASGLRSFHPAGQSSDEVLKNINEEFQYKEIIQSSFQNGTQSAFTGSNNGFVKAAVQAYSQHHHLRIRPDDVWLAILTQLSSYINAHAEESRGSFVAHEGKKELVILYEPPNTRYTVDFADFAEKIGVTIQDNVVDPDLRQWILPTFSTTTDNDLIVANIVMMASMQAYFEYICGMTCGLPSVTLLGEKEDYQLILLRLKKLKSYGPEPTAFAELLAPVIEGFVKSFDNPNAQEIIDFWNHILTSWNMGSGPDFYSGWITAFVFWDKDGKPLNRRDDPWLDQELPRLRMGGATYHRVSSDDVPPGYCTVPVKIDEYGTEIKAEMLAGSIGWDCIKSGEEMAAGSDESRPDSMQPKSGWWIYEKADEDLETALVEQE